MACAVYEKDVSAWKRDKNAGADEKPDAPEEPPYPQVFSTDATVEALATVLEQNPRGMLFLQDELAAWARAMNQYKGGKGADRQHWLSFWNGATTVVNRKSRKEPIVLRDPFVCVAGCMPPDVLGDLADEAGREDGFVHRILFVYPDVQALTWTDAVDSRTRPGYLRRGDHHISMTCRDDKYVRRGRPARFFI